MERPIDPSVSIAMSCLFSVVFLAVVSLLAAKARAMDTKLILMGLFTAVAAVLYGDFRGHEGLGVRVSGPGGAAGVAAGLSFGGPAAGLMKIAVLLVLGGVAVALLTRGVSPTAITETRENGRHVP